ncbi:MAG: CPBP family intramembrane metalloprotease [Planctomycetota bacterium]|jgi:membrane protease YdiL (CAAX protease family)|nr:CPBP family intramembrane metalloprotease [Planctomycetota bacterium]
MEPLSRAEGIESRGGYQSYLADSSAPLAGLYFTLPLFIVYHVGLWWLNTFAGLRWANAVDIAIGDVLGRFGLAGPLLSFMLVIIVFILTQTLSGKPARRPPPHTWLLMILESLILSLPVFLLSRLALKLGDYIRPAFLSTLEGGESGLSWAASLILSCGAGVYEEFFFRLLLMGAIILFMNKVLRLKGGWSNFLAACIQAVLFAASHHLPGGPEEVADWSGAWNVLPAFAFRTAAGLYFAFVYLERGFGIAAGSHAGYDLLVVALDLLMPLD